jgi:hypothetical protein
VTKADILVAEHIFGPDLHLAKPTIEPSESTGRYRNVTLAADVMHMNGMPMLITYMGHDCGGRIRQYEGS